MKAYKALGLLLVSCYLYGCTTHTEKEYYTNGKIKKSTEFSHGKLNGLFQSYYENGQISLISSYVNGAKFGKQLQYYETGKLKEEAFFNNDTLIGVFHKYFNNGGIHKDFFYIHGNLNGAGF
jgi:antitoxin component YwqK of YwqJK toxin-antitoxin module